MKKSGILFILPFLLLGSCNQGKGTYTISGTLDGGQDGDSVFISAVSGNQLVPEQSTVIKDGGFTFKGQAATPAERYLVIKKLTGESGMVDFFVEEGKIKVSLDKESSAVTGTQNNDIYQELKDKIAKLENEMSGIQASMMDSSLSEDKKMEQLAKANAMEEQYTGLITETIKKNASSFAGAYLLKQYYYYLDTPSLEEICDNISPELIAKDEQIARIQSLVEVQKKTAVGKMFTDFEMDDPEGNKVRLSDYAGKGHYLLIDFWASWCGPCRQEMPNLKRTYEDFHSKGFDVVGVSLDQTKEAWIKGIKDLDLAWPQMSDVKYWDCEAAKLYAISAIPHTVLLDKDGTILARELRGDALYQKIKELTE